MRGIRKCEKGLVIIEAAFVFPIMFYVIFFLIYMGNAYYVRSHVQSAVELVAIEGAAYCADPFLERIYQNEGAIPSQNKEIQPYHYWFSRDGIETKVKKNLEDRLRTMGTGLFDGMSPKLDSCKVEYENKILYNTFTVTITYSVKLPLRFMGTEPVNILKMSVKSVAPVTDTAEFIKNIDMAYDYYENTGAKDKVDEVIGKAKDFLGKFKN